MQKLQTKVKEFLESYPHFRERKMRALCIWEILGFSQLQMIPREHFCQYIFKQILSLNRTINWVQQHYPNLRGLDYNDKKKLQQKAMINLGYSPGIDQQIKKLKQST